MTRRKKPTTKDVIAFLDESNLIELVYDQDSLKQAKRAWDFLVDQNEMTPDVILETHRVLMSHQPLLPSEIGHFRQCPVYINDHETLDSRLIGEQIEILATNMWLRPKNWKRHHIWYEKIHPFVDGNGRTGRMFMNWERLRAGLPILIIKAAEWHKYFEWFK